MALDDLEPLKRLVLNVETLPTAEQAQNLLQGLYKDWEDLCAFFLGNKISQIWNVEFVQELRRVITRLAGYDATKPVLEIGAGTGKLGYHLQQAGVPITMVDNGSWGIDGGELVERVESHMESLGKYQPQIVLVAWPDQMGTVRQDALAFPSVRYMVTVEDPIGGGASGPENEGIQMYRSSIVRHMKSCDPFIVQAPAYWRAQSFARVHVFDKQADRESPTG